MIIKITQCNIGSYNLLSSEKSLSFYMSIFTEDNKIYEENGIKAQLHYSGSPDEIYIFENAIENLGEVYEKCFDFSNKVWSTTDYKSQCLLFAKVYHENFDTLEINMKSRRDKNIIEEINRLQKQLSHGMLKDISYEVVKSINRQINANQKMIDYYQKINQDLKEDSDSYKKNLDIIKRYEILKESFEKELITFDI